MTYSEKITELVKDLNKMANNPFLNENRENHGCFFMTDSGSVVIISFLQDGHPRHDIVRRSYSREVDVEQVYSMVYYEFMTFILFGIDCINGNIKDAFDNSINIITVQTLIKKGLPKNV